MVFIEIYPNHCGLEMCLLNWNEKGIVLYLAQAVRLTRWSKFQLLNQCDMKFKEYVNNNILFALQQAKSGRSIL